MVLVLNVRDCSGQSRLAIPTLSRIGRTAKSRIGLSSSVDSAMSWRFVSVPVQALRARVHSAPSSVFLGCARASSMKAAKNIVAKSQRVRASDCWLIRCAPRETPACRQDSEISSGAAHAPENGDHCSNEADEVGAHRHRMAASGTKLPIRDVGSSAAAEGKPDITRKVRFGSV